MSKDFRPKAEQLTLSSIIGRGILHELACADTGQLTIKNLELTMQNSKCEIEPCEIGLYAVSISNATSETEYFVLCGQTESGKVLDHDACQALLSLPIEDYTEGDHKSPHWLKSGGLFHKLDELVPKKELLNQHMERLSPAQADEIERIKQRVSIEKAALSREINALDSKAREAAAELETVTGDRLKRLALQKKVNQLRQEYMKRQESQCFDTMRLDMELEEQIKAFAEKEKLMVKVTREFLVQVTGNG